MINRGTRCFKSAFDCSTALMFAGEISDRFKRSIRGPDFVSQGRESGRFRPDRNESERIRSSERDFFFARSWRRRDPERIRSRGGRRRAIGRRSRGFGVRFGDDRRRVRFFLRGVGVRVKGLFSRGKLGSSRVHGIAFPRGTHFALVLILSWKSDAETRSDCRFGGCY